jgi:hypothetical protein
MIFPKGYQPQLGDGDASKLVLKRPIPLAPSQAGKRDPADLWVPITFSPSERGGDNVQVSARIPHEIWEAVQEAISSRHFPWRTQGDAIRTALYLLVRDVLGPDLERRWSSYLKRREATRRAAWLDLQAAEWHTQMEIISKAIKRARETGLEGRAVDLARRTLEDLAELEQDDPEVAAAIKRQLVGGAYPDLAAAMEEVA